MTDGNRHRLPVAFGAGGLAMAWGAGGSSSSSSSSGTSAATSSNAAASSNGANLAQATAIYSKFTGASAGRADASKSPVVIGFVNDEGGIPSFPEGSAAAQAAVKFVNDNLGGVGGHPVQLKVCSVAGSEEQGQGCAQQFVGDKQIK